jgi:hypothetical protein
MTVREGEGDVYRIPGTRRREFCREQYLCGPNSFPASVGDTKPVMIDLKTMIES